MPIYEYQCKSEAESCEYCIKPFEVFQKMKDPPVEICPRCANEVSKNVSSFGFNTKKNVKKMLSDENLKAHGFSKFANEGGGKLKKLV
ncbi:FmdB family zinc ribbon protein [Candidatus Riflebacteria bacterium]